MKEEMVAEVQQTVKDKMSDVTFLTVSFLFYFFVFSAHVSVSSFSLFWSSHVVSTAVQIRLERLSGLEAAEHLQIYFPLKLCLSVLQYSPGIDRFESKDPSVLQMWTKRSSPSPKRRIGAEAKLHSFSDAVYCVWLTNTYKVFSIRIRFKLNSIIFN